MRGSKYILVRTSLCKLNCTKKASGYARNITRICFNYPRLSGSKFSMVKKKNSGGILNEKIYRTHRTLLSPLRVHKDGLWTTVISAVILILQFQSLPVLRYSEKKKV